MMNKGILYSGIGHVSLILWAALGGLFHWEEEPPPLQATTVSLMTSDEFDAMMAAAPSAPTAAETAAPQPQEEVTSEEPAPEEPAPEEPTPPPPPPRPEPEPQPEPQPVEEVAPPAPEPVTPPTEAPPAEIPQPVEVPLSSQRPKPRPAERIADTPTPQTEAPQEAETAQPATEESVEPAEEQPVEEAQAPEETVTNITPEADPVEEEAPTLAPTSSPRPAARPRDLGQSEPDPAPTATATATADSDNAADSATQSAEETASATDQSAVEDALAAALAEEANVTDAPEAQASTQGEGGAGSEVSGPPLSSGEISDLHNAIAKKWNIGALSTEASGVIVTIRVKLSEDQKILSVELVEATGGSDAAARQAFEAAKRAVSRAANEGLGLPPDKYETWKSILITFDPSKGRLR